MLTSFCNLLRTNDCSALPRIFFLVLWPLLTSHSSLLLRIFFNMSTPNTPVRPPRVLTRSFPLYLPHLPNTIRVAIGLYFDVQTHPYVRPYMRFLFVRPEFCPLGDLSTPKIRLSSDSASRRTPLPLAKFFSLPGDFGTFTLENVRSPGARAEKSRTVSWRFDFFMRLGIFCGS